MITNETPEHGKLYNLLFTRMSNDPEKENLAPPRITPKSVLFFILKTIWFVIKAILFCLYSCFCAGGVWVAILGYTLLFMLVFSMRNIMLECLFVAISLLTFLTLGYLIVRAIQTGEAKEY